MISATRIQDLPAVPAVYALVDSRWVAYVGSGGSVKQRVHQHLSLRNTSVTTGSAAVSLDPKMIEEVRWWQHSEFVHDNVLRAAEMIAAAELKPTLRSRANTPSAAKALARKDAFSVEMANLFRGQPSGRLQLTTVETLIHRVVKLEEEVQALKARQS